MFVNCKDPICSEQSLSLVLFVAVLSVATLQQQHSRTETDDGWDNIVDNGKEGMTC